MPKRTKYPGLRVHVRRGKAGQLWSSWYYDKRMAGTDKDIPLGQDYDQAVEQWKQIKTGGGSKGRLKEAFDRWEEEELPNRPAAGTRRTYAQHLKKLRPVFEQARWAEVTLPALKDYLKKRTAKTQANREMAVLSVIWNWARLEGLTELPWPASGMERSRWKNKETPRQFDVTDAVFEAVYACAEPMLKDCMDLASATGMRLTDCRGVLLPSGGSLSIRASKTGKRVDFDLSTSALLVSLVARRRAVSAPHLFLLTMPNGKRVTEANLRGAWDRARDKAATRAREEEKEDLAQQIEAMYLRDLRKRAASLAGSLEEASELLQHSSKRVTQIHYRPATKVRPVR